MERSRQISPYTRKADSPYKIQIEGLKKTELLIVTITHKEIPSFKEIYEFEGNDLQEKKSIHFKWDGKMIIWLGGVKPINKSIAKTSIHSCMITFVGLITTFFMFGFVGCSKGAVTSISETMNDLQKYNIKGNVEKIQTSTFEPINSAKGVIAGRKLEYGENSTIKFNENGYKSIVFRENDTSELYLYDEDNRLILEQDVSWNEELRNYAVNKQKDYKYANGFLCVENYINYDNEENILTVYCNNGQQVTNSIVYESGVVSSETEYVYDGGIKKEEIIHRYLNLHNGSIDTLTFHHFYHNGFVYKVKSSNSISERIRNEKNDIVETIHCKIADIDMIYNVPGTFLYVYEYDEHDNWIRRTEWKKMEDETVVPCSITTREITYRQ